ncbi:MAG: hypothetical protein SNJ77_07500 [Cytophagales bacterium]
MFAISAFSNQGAKIERNPISADFLQIFSLKRSDYYNQKLWARPAGRAAFGVRFASVLRTSRYRVCPTHPSRGLRKTRLGNNKSILIENRYFSNTIFDFYQNDLVNL